MILDPDVAAAAKHFGLDPRLVQAVCKAEGNILKAVQCSIPSIHTREQALDVLCRSCVHAMSDFIQLSPTERSNFVSFWAARWAPEGAANDPTSLNANWPVNVLKFWTGGA